MKPRFPLRHETVSDKNNFASVEIQVVCDNNSKGSRSVRFADLLAEDAIHEHQRVTSTGEFGGRSLRPVRSNWKDKANWNENFIFNLLN
jgi:hypothetical protein